MTSGSNLLMSDAEFSFHYHKLIFKLVCHEKQGNAFQTFFENIMELVDSNFVKIKPAGKVGDWKCDGWSSSTGTCYQVYAPEKLTNAKAAKKNQERLQWSEESLER